MLRLFDDNPRNYTKPSLRAETTYSFLNRSSLPAFERVRRMLQRWVERLSKTHQQKLVSRMRHRSPGSRAYEIQFSGAFFELFLNEFLRGTGGRVEIEPVIDGLTPDFRVTEELAGGSQITYAIEATDFDLERGTNLERDWNELSAIDTLNEISSSDFSLYIQTNGQLEYLPRKRDLKKPFEHLIETANYENALRIAQNHDSDLQDFPKASFCHGGWTVVGHLYPVLPENRGKTKTLVGISPKKAAVIDDIGRTKDKLYKKARKYRNVDNLIIALRCDISNNRFDEVLFGSQQLTFYQHNDPSETAPLPSPHYSQKLNGFWFNSLGPQHQNVIGVVAFYGVYPGTLDSSSAIFYPNPYVDTLMPDWTKSITHAEYSDGEIRTVEGTPPYTFLRDYEVIGNPFS